MGRVWTPIPQEDLGYFLFVSPECTGHICSLIKADEILRSQWESFCFHVLGD
jgi:hypothetical protein